MKEYIGTIKGIDLIKKSAPRARIICLGRMQNEINYYNITDYLFTDLLFSLCCF